MTITESWIPGAVLNRGLAVRRLLEESWSFCQFEAKSEGLAMECIEKVVRIKEKSVVRFRPISVIASVCSSICAAWNVSARDQVPTPRQKRFPQNVRVYGH